MNIHTFIPDPDLPSRNIGGFCQECGLSLNGGNHVIRKMIDVSDDFKAEFRRVLEIYLQGCSHTIGEPPTSCHECTDHFVDLVDKLRREAP